MAQYNGPDGLVEAEQRTGQPMTDVTIVQKKWGPVGVVQTADGEQWMAPGDWLVRANGVLTVVSPAIFDRDYEATPGASPAGE